MKKESGNWTKYRDLHGRVREYDCHFGEDHGLTHYELKQKVYDDVLDILRQEYENNDDWVLVTHGLSSSRMGTTSSRSQVRKLAKSRDATPFIIRKECVQHESVFVFAIKKMNIKQ